MVSKAPGMEDHQCPPHRAAAIRPGCAFCGRPVSVPASAPRSVRGRRRLACAEQPAGGPGATTAKPVLVLDLIAARKLAQEKQPALAAARASLAAAQAKVKALDNLGNLTNLARRDLCIRKQQAALGVLIAEARLRQAEIETTYCVTRCYWTVVYAQDQFNQVERALEGKGVRGKNLRTIKEDIARFRLERGEDKWLLDYHEMLVKVAEGRREEARIGVQRALAALREAIGLEDSCPLACVDQELPEVLGMVSCPQIVGLALKHRPEIAQAGWGAEVFALEVKAQDLVNTLRADTFAAGSDLHVIPLPTASFGEDYRPGAVAPEMPTILVGPRCLRVEQAEALQQRSLAVLAKVQSLIRLEAENTCLLWLEARGKLPSYEQAAQLAEKVTQAALDQLPREGSKTTIAEMLDALMRQALLRQQANQTQFQLILQSAALERVTGGNFCPEYRRPAEKDATREKTPEK